MISWNAFVRNAHVLHWNEKMCVYVICHRIVRCENCVLFLYRSFTLKDNHVLWKCMNFMICFLRNAHVLLWNEKHLFGICQNVVKTEISVPFLCRSFTFKDNPVILTVYEFHEMLLWETHMCFSAKIRHWFG